MSPPRQAGYLNPEKIRFADSVGGLLEILAAPNWNMTRSLIAFFYGTVLIVAGPTLGVMLAVEYDGAILPVALARWLLVSLIGIVLCDWILQYGIRRGYIG